MASDINMFLIWIAIQINRVFSATLTFTVQPSSSPTVGSTFSVTVTKSESNDPTIVYLQSTSTSVRGLYGTTAISDSTTTSLVFNGLYFLSSTSSSITLRAYAYGYTAVTSNSFTISAQSTFGLYFSAQPSTMVSGTALTSGLAIKVLTIPLGLLVVNSVSYTITFTLVAKDGSGTLTLPSCTTSSGVCSPSSYQINGYGTFLIKASNANCNDTYSQPIIVTSGTPSTATLNAFTSSLYRGQSFTATGTVVDSSSIRVNQAFTFNLVVSSGPGSIVQGASATVVNGVLTFTDVVINTAGSYSLTLSCPSCTALGTPNTVAATVLSSGKLYVNFVSPVLESSSGYYQLSLTQAPSSSVVVSISSSDSTVVSVVTTSVTFTTGNYNVPQNVYINVDKVASASNPYTGITISHSLSSSDLTYSGSADYKSCAVSSSSVQLQIFGYQEYSVKVDASVTMAEAAQAEVTVKLGGAPAVNKDVTINIAVSNAAISISVSKLVFTSSAWGYKTFTVSGPAAGTLVSSYSTYSLSYSISTTDSNYNSGSLLKYPSTLSTVVVVTKKATNSIVLSASASFLESKHYGNYFVRLSGIPTTTVTVSLAAANSNVVVAPTSLTFSTSTSEIPQEISVYAANTAPTVPSYTVVVTHTSSSSDSSFNSLTKTHTVTISTLCENLPYGWPQGATCSCPAGFNCRGIVPVPCPAGTYNSGSSISCTACPAGSSCANPAVAPVACTGGTYSYDYYTACYTCPAGYACVANGYLMTRCLQGAYYQAGGSCATAGTTTVSLSPESSISISCPTGYYVKGASDTCVPCPAGYSCSGSTATACTTGKYSLAGFGTCIDCPDNMDCDASLGPHRVCPEGTYRTGTTSWTCIVCPANSYCSNSVPGKATCTSGSSAAGASFCVSSNTWGSYPGLSLSGSTVTACSVTSNYDCVVGSTYNNYKDKVRCLADYGRCYPIPGGENALASPANSGKFSYPGHGSLLTGFVGYNLPANADRPDLYGFECEPGYYCTSPSSKTACPAGKFYPTVRATASTDCMTCPPGYECPAGTGDFELYPCPGGKYCNKANVNSVSCPSGTFRNTLRGINEGSCEICPEGYYCGSGTTNPTLCTTGDVCPLGSPAKQFCPDGTYNMFTGKYKIEDCILCPAGAYCSGTGPSIPKYCLPGTYNPYQGSKVCFPCTAGYACIGYSTITPYVRCNIGYYCPEGSSSPIQNPCPPGTVGTQYGSYSITQCEKCPPGFYCGYAFNYVNNPPLPCPAGYYCPIGTESKYRYQCPKGTYSTRTRLEGLHECLTCPKGFFCNKTPFLTPGTPTVPTAGTNNCPAGYFCPLGSLYNWQNPCPAGTYRATVGATEKGECLMCPAGKYCPTATVTPLDCPAGTYMDELGAKNEGPGDYPSCKPCPAGYFSSSAGTISCTPAAIGKYTYKGATAETTCAVGHFCARVGTSEYTMQMSPCPAGYLCPAGTSTYPSLAQACPIGNYCLEGASVATPCAAGTYRNTVAAKSVYDCAKTPAGYFTAIAGISDYSTNVCQAGYYCPAGSISAMASACPAGTYRAATGGKAATDCGSCPPGFYCPNIAMTTPTACPITNYCPAGTITPLQCPKGTYGTVTGLKTSSDCTPCDAGKYCVSPGLSAVTGNCLAAYYCIGGSTLESPLDGVTGDLCPAGGFCLAGATSPSACPAGTFNNFQGGYTSADCVACWPGYYCLGQKNPTPTAQCDAGYFCTGSSSVATQNTAQAGYYAPLGSVAQIPCLKGTYNPSTAQSSCLDCPAGAYCPTQSMTTFTTCPAGFYCTQKSFIQTPCPVGTFKSSTGGQSVDQCTPCTAGKYCSTAGLTAVTGDCDAGYSCLAGATSKQPWIYSAGFYSRCPAGYYCSAGAASPTACAVGYFNPSSGAEDNTGCVICPAGYVCLSTATTTYTTTQCKAGYFCAEGSTTNQPVAGQCPVGYYCPTGAAVALKCPAGTYQDLTIQSSCKTCPPGYYCPIGTSNYLLYLCPAGYYCPSGTTYGTQYPCAVGTFNPYVGQQVVGSCQPCSSGKYCNTNGASVETGTCAAGFYCTSSSTTPRPTSAAMGGRCTKGSYCPAGASSPVQCDSGFYCPDDEMSAVGPGCAEGYYCTLSATTATPTDGTTGNLCSKHNYCAAGSSYPSQCNAGTYIPYTGASSSSECLACTPGFFCDGTDPQICTAGYYCPGGDSSPTLECSRGFYCPSGSSDQIPCAGGTYQDNSGQSSCKACVAGYYCAANAPSMTLCPKGYYCLANTQYNYQYPCQAGTYNGQIGQSSSAACVACGGGSFCSTQGAQGPTGLCAAGYYCTGGAITAQPTDGTTGNICSEGYYCPEGSTNPTSCDAGSYCNQKGLSAPSGTCSAGYYCILRAVSSTPTDGTTGNICSAGKYCPAGSFSQEDCQAGTYSPSTGLSDPNMCLSCNYGKYCSTSGLTAPTGTCSNGFFCLPGKDSATPTDGTCPTGSYCNNAANYVAAPCAMGYYNDQVQQAACFACTAGSYCTGSTALPISCPKGYRCPVTGSGATAIGTRFSSEFPCGPGTYSSVLGNSVCTTCPIGYQCNTAAQSPDNLCPTYKYCPAGTGYGLICPPGTYNKDYQGLGATTDCTSCPAGQYCVDGTISGQCAPGFWCKGGSSTPTPVTTTTTGLPCPPGYYCLKGTTTPILCPSGKFRQNPGARSDTDCTSCPPGSYCVSGITTPFPCTTGHYCPVGVDAPISCPIRTYNDVTGADNANFCKICPGGYLCNAVGISKYTDYPCKKGYFCVQGATDIINCPPGTYTYTTNAASIYDCLPCPGGFYCPANTTDIISCPYGTYCPGGNSLYWPCPPGYLCNIETTVPVACASGQYCPLYNRLNASLNAPPNDCAVGTLCPGAYFDEASCSAGYYYDISEGICLMCAPGTYSDGQKSENCQPCLAGYICTGGSTRKDPRGTSDRGYPCPAGYYCPLGALVPIACPIATYNPSTASTAATSCILCPNMTYGDETGQSKCKSCGSNANSTAGSTTCTCMGKFRFYQKYDGSCFCIPTYEFTDNGVSASDVDSPLDCRPIQYQACISGEVRKADGSCTGSPSAQCVLECGGNVTSKLTSDYGICPCNNAVDQGQICDDSCIQKLPSVFLNSDGSYQINDPVSGESVNVKLTGSNYLASVKCAKQCPVHSLYFSSDGISGGYGVPGSLLNLYYSQTNRRLGVASDKIPNPIVCFAKGDTVIFSLEPKNNFPLYLKKSLINTNKNFDFAAFKELQWRMESSQSNVDTFAFTFSDEGFYDLVNKNNQDQHVILKVVSDASKCAIPKRSQRDLATTSTIFYTKTDSNMAGFGFAPAKNLIEDPNWGAIAGLLVASFILLLVFISFLAFLHWRAWATSHARERLLQLVKDCCRRCKLSKPALIAPLIVEDESDSVDLNRDLLEPSQFTEMLQRLNRYYIQLQAAFDSQDEDAKRSLEDLLGQAKDLKILLGDRLSDVDPVVLREKVREAQMESSEEESQEVPEIVPLVVSEELNIAIGALKEAEANNKERLAMEVYNKISSNPHLHDKEKEELLQDYEANMQRIDQVLDQDVERAQNDINRRLQERAARRKAAEREKAYIEPKRNEIISRNAREKELIDKELQGELNSLEHEFIEERDKIKKENRREVDEKLKEMRTQLQADLMHAKNQVEIDNLMKIFEIESRRIEDQLVANKKQQEAEVLKRLEERRKKRQDKIEGRAGLRKAELDARNQEELEGLEQRALLASVKVNMDIDVRLDMNEEQLISEIADNYNQRLGELEGRHQKEIENIDREIQAEEEHRAAEKQRLEKLLQATDAPEERAELLKALESFENAESEAKLKQEDRVKARLQERQRKRAEREALLKRNHQAEINEIEAQKLNAEKELRSEFELRKMEEILQNNEKFTPEELIAMARELLEAKHDREVANLTTLKHAKLRERQNESVKFALEKKAQDKANQKAQYEQLKASIKAEKIDPESKKAKLADLDAKMLEAESQIDYAFVIGINTDQDRIWRETENDFRQRFADLADAQTNEIQQILSRIKGVDARMLDANIADMEQEIEQQRAELGRKHAEKLRELDKRAKEIQDIESQRMQEIDFINSQLKETLEKQRVLDEVHSQRRVMEERQKKVLDAMKDRGISQEKMEEILKQHQKEMDEWEKAIENERIRQQEKLQLKLDARRQRYNERKALMVQKFNQENEKVKEQQLESEQNKMKIVFDCGREIKIWAPSVEIDTRLRFPDIKEEQEIAKIALPSVLEEVITKVRRVEKIAENIDSKQFNLLLKAFSDVSEMMEAVKSRIRQ